MNAIIHERDIEYPVVRGIGPSPTEAPAVRELSGL
jgi:hypothetical protein